MCVRVYVGACVRNQHIQCIRVHVCMWSTPPPKKKKINKKKKKKKSDYFKFQRNACIFPS